MGARPTNILSPAGSPMLLLLLVLLCSTFQTVVVAAENIYVSTTGRDSNLGTENSPLRTVTYAVGVASDGDTIILEDGRYTETSSINIVNRLLTIRSASGLQDVTISLPRDKRALFNLTKANATLSGMTLNGSDGNQSCILVESSSVQLRSIDIVSCTHTQDWQIGGGALIVSGTSTMNAVNCSFRNNKSRNPGGAISMISGTTELYNCTFSDNRAESFGGAIFADAGSRSLVHDSLFTNNSAQNEGGAIFSRRSDLRLSGCSFLKGSAVFGSAVQSVFGVAQVNNTLFMDNKDATAVENNQGTMSVDGCRFVNNSAIGNKVSPTGGAINNFLSTLRVVNTSFLNNSAPSGGAIYNSAQNRDVIFDNCTLLNNWAVYEGGAVFNYLYSNLTMSNSILAFNTAQNGGGIALRVSSSNLTDCIIANNTATNAGGGASFAGGISSWTSCLFDLNSAPESADYFLSSTAAFSCNDCSFISFPTSSTTTTTTTSTSTTTTTESTTTTETTSTTSTTTESTTTTETTSTTSTTLSSEPTTSSQETTTTQTSTPSRHHNSGLWALLVIPVLMVVGGLAYWYFRVRRKSAQHAIVYSEVEVGEFN